MLKYNILVTNLQKSPSAGALRTSKIRNQTLKNQL